MATGPKNGGRKERPPRQKSQKKACMKVAKVAQFGSFTVRMEPGQIASFKGWPPLETPSTPTAQANNRPPPEIPDHELLRCIGRGSYGAVWLARNMFGVYRAVKIVFRASFTDQHPFDRELKGIRKFEPVSRSHEGFVDVLQVGNNKAQGYFYYVMELGDDQALGKQLDPERYSPKTLGKEITLHGR